MRPGKSRGTWYLRVDLPSAPGEPRKQRRETCYGSKREAEDRLRELLSEAKSGRVRARKALTFGDVCDAWLAAHRDQVSRRSYETYRQRIEGRIRPTLGDIPAEDLSAASIASAKEAWLRGARFDKGKGGQPSTRTVALVFTTLRSICTWASALDKPLLPRNPSVGVRPPKVRRREMQTLDAAEVVCLFDAARGTELEPLVVVAVATGLRRGELLGLRWGDVDFDGATLSVRRSIEYVDGRHHAKPPKTDRSRRPVALPGFAVEALRRYRAEQKMWHRVGPDDAVFRRIDGEPWTLAAFTNAFRRLARGAGFPIRLHDLRHTYAQTLLDQGIDLDTVSRALGHSSISITSDVYLHGSEKRHRIAAEKLEALFNPPEVAAEKG